MSAVAAATEVSRPSVCKELGDRAGLGRALVLRETRGFLEGVARTLHSGLPDADPRPTARRLSLMTLKVLR
ncbi:hypothetical protein QNO07_01885 [Streptomyces sp. 549]|uniref:hypothetical protein n=1 Tax=Streptomyces sp. 549 TaxID=3049076 RepID=UPI0024C40FCF|nr:hypothetical protein [Streptomyces sp. 549]MDK1472185.1 hypothetical protein [Streptomyces sp. 549]